MTTETLQAENEAAGGQSRAGEAGANLTAVLERWAKWIVNNPPYIGGDHACAECYPNSEILVPGFRCVYHEALSVNERSNAELTGARSASERGTSDVE